LRVPDGCALRTLLLRRGYDIGRRYSELLGLDRGPARRRYLEHARVIERVDARIELGIGPHRLQFHRADRIRVCRLLDVHRAADRRHDAGPFIGLAIARPNDIENFLEALAALRPSLHDLDAVE